MSQDSVTDLSMQWLPLLRRLTDASPRWGIWKNVDSALNGSGDIDSTAPAEDWDMIEKEFVSWALSNGFGPAASCRHVPGVLFLVAVDRSTRALYELDVNARKYFRGWTMFRPDDLAAVMEMDPRGFRRVRAGAEAMILLVQNGTKWGGRVNPEGLAAKGVIARLAADPQGVEDAARLFGPARGAAAGAASEVAQGGWDRRAMMAVEARSVAGAIAQPHITATRIWSRYVKTRCPILRVIFQDDRRVPDDVDGWMAQVAKHHPVYDGILE
jgi:hypothetical protein